MSSMAPTISSNRASCACIVGHEDTALAGVLQCTFTPHNAQCRDSLAHGTNLIGYFGARREHLFIGNGHCNAETVVAHAHKPRRYHVENGKHILHNGTRKRTSCNGIFQLAALMLRHCGSEDFGHNERSSARERLVLKVTSDKRGGGSKS